MATLRDLIKLSTPTSRALAGGAQSRGGQRGAHQLSWELVAGALAQPRLAPGVARPPIEPYARLLVLGELSAPALAYLCGWLIAGVPGASVREGAVALHAAMAAEACTLCNALGTVAGGTQTCPRCDGRAVRLPGERAVAELLGVTRYAYRQTYRARHHALIGRITELHVTLEEQLRRG